MLTMLWWQNNDCFNSELTNLFEIIFFCVLFLLVLLLVLFFFLYFFSLNKPFYLSTYAAHPQSMGNLIQKNEEDNMKIARQEIETGKAMLRKRMKYMVDSNFVVLFMNIIQFIKKNSLNNGPHQLNKFKNSKRQL